MLVTRRDTCLGLRGSHGRFKKSSHPGPARTHELEEDLFLYVARHEASHLLRQGRTRSKCVTLLHGAFPVVVSPKVEFTLSSHSFVWRPRQHRHIATCSVSFSYGTILLGQIRDPLVYAVEHAILLRGITCRHAGPRDFAKLRAGLKLRRKEVESITNINIIIIIITITIITIIIFIFICYYYNYYCYYYYYY